MNTPSTPPPIPGTGAAEPETWEPIRGFAAAIEAVLREPRRVMHALRQPQAGAVIGALLVAAAINAVIYGLVVGSFSGGGQYWIAPVKIVVGLLASSLICLPSLFIFATLGGANVRLGEVGGILAGKLALITILLVGFAPVAWVFSQSTASIGWMGALHLVFWVIAAGFGMRFLHAAFGLLLKSRSGILLWIVIYVLVALQMTTALRPILGSSPDFLPKEKKFFLAHWSEVLSGGERNQRPAANE